MTNAWSLCLLAAILAGRGGAARAQEGLDRSLAGEPEAWEIAADEALVLSEYRREVYERASGERARITLPILDPRLDGVSTRPVTVDGDLRDAGWLDATTFIWTAAGDSSVLDAPTWRLRALLTESRLYLAGHTDSLRLDEEPLPVLSLQSSWREQLFLTLGRRGASRVELETPRAGGDATAHGFELAVAQDEGVVSWELAIPRDGGAWELPLGALRPLRMTLDRGRPTSTVISPPFRLLPYIAAGRLELLESENGPRLVAQVRVDNASRRAIVVRTDLDESARIGRRGTEAFRFQGAVAPGVDGFGWSLQIGELAAHVGIPTAFLDAAPLIEEVSVHLARARRNLSRHGGADPSLRATLEGLEKLVPRLGDAEIESVEKVYLAARKLVRQTFLSGLPADLRRIVFVLRPHDRIGPFYTSYLNDLPGGGLVALDPRDGERESLLQATGGTSVRGLDASFDSRRLVYALRQRGEGVAPERADSRTHLRVLELSTGESRTLTGGEAHDLEPAWLADDRVVFVSNRHGGTSPINATDAFCLHTVDPRDGAVERLSYNNLVDFTPAVLEDGRIAFLRWVLEDKPGFFVNALWTIYPDGRGIAGLFGMNRAGVTLSPRAVPGGDGLVCIALGENGHWRAPRAGDVARISLATSENRIVRRLRSDTGEYADPLPLNDDITLVAYGNARTRWGIYAVDFDGNRELLARHRRYSCFLPRALRAPRRGHHIPDLTASESDRPARLIVQDVYQGLPGVARGTVQSLRVVGVPDRPRVDGEAPFQDQTRVLSVSQRWPRVDLGSVPVEADGSLYFEVPAETNLFFQLLDERGRLVQTMRDTLHFASGEGRSCIGCHEPRQATPAGPRSASPVALARAPSPLQRDLATARPDFVRDVQPILDRHCVRCHDAGEAAAGVELSGDLTPFFTLSYETLTRGGRNYRFLIESGDRQRRSAPSAPPYAGALSLAIEEIPAGSTGSAASPLLELLDAGHHDARPDDEAMRVLARWIDFNLPFHDDWTGGRSAGAGRQSLLSARSARTIEEVLRARCRGCHVTPHLFRGGVVNLSRPERSALLRAPLVADAGGRGVCRKPIFTSREDPEYRAILDALRADRDRAGLRGTGEERGAGQDEATATRDTGSSDDPSTDTGSRRKLRSP